MPQKGPEMGEVKPWWLDLVLIGFEDDDDDSDDEDVDDEDDEEEEDESDEDDEDSDDEDDDEDEDEDEDEKSKTKSKKPDVKGLKSALRKERMGHKKFKRLYNQKVAQEKKGKKPDSSSDKDKDKEEEIEDKGPSERERKLADKLKEAAIDGVVTRYATKLNFLDTEDAVRLVKRSEIEYDQDEEDPTLIEIDEESVEDAVKELARKKKHLVGSRKGNTRTGSTFGGKSKKSKTSSDDAIRDKFGLRRPTM